MDDVRLKKSYEKYLNRHGINDRLPDYDLSDCRLVVVIPAYLEKDYIFDCLDSLHRSALNVNETISVIVVVNASEISTARIIREQEELYRSLVVYAESNSGGHIRFIPLKIFNVRKKHAGVGSARKLGMDQAVNLFYKNAVYDGIIVSLDADTLVAENYFEEILKYFSRKESTGCSICFEHPLTGDEGMAAASYELHLRYYKQALGFTGYPYSFHTVGSAFALRSSAYVMAGGMPRKQAGEDFYLIQKVVLMGGYGDLNTTCVYPSSRPSDRVPFGTGPVVKKLLSDESAYKTYAPRSFYALKNLFDNRSMLYGITGKEYDMFLNKLDEPLGIFLKNDRFFNELGHLNDNCSSVKVFEKRFFEVFNAFKVVKYLNFAHDGYFQKIPVADAASVLLTGIGVKMTGQTDVMSLLKIFRDLDRGSYNS